CMPKTRSGGARRWAGTSLNWWNADRSTTKGAVLDATEWPPSKALEPSGECPGEVDATWLFQDGYAVSPVINDALIENWPYSGDGFDEWYFFRVVPPVLKLAPYCNWCSVSVGDWQQLTFRMDLGAQL